MVFNTFCSFGSSLANLGDLDNNGYQDIAVGAPDRNERMESGRVFIIFSNLLVFLM